MRKLLSAKRYFDVLLWTHLQTGEAGWATVPAFISADTQNLPIATRKGANTSHHSGSSCVHGLPHQQLSIVSATAMAP